MREGENQVATWLLQHFDTELVQRQSRGSTEIPLPTSPKQVRPLLEQ